MPPVKAKKIEILQTGCPVLREVSSPIAIAKIKLPEIKTVISNLKKTIENQKDAAAISAVQIGKPIRLFVISRKVFGMDSKNPEEFKAKKDLVFIDPKITKFSKTKQILEEGCLSVKYVYGKVSRPEKVTIEAYDETGKKFSRGFSGLLAQIVQHENDHLNGILFTDKATDIQEISKEEYDKMIESL